MFFNNMQSNGATHAAAAAAAATMHHFLVPVFFSSSSSFNSYNNNNNNNNNNHPKRRQQSINTNDQAMNRLFYSHSFDFPILKNIILIARAMRDVVAAAGRCWSSSMSASNWKIPLLLLLLFNEMKIGVSDRRQREKIVLLSSSSPSSSLCF